MQCNGSLLHFLPSLPSLFSLLPLPSSLYPPSPSLPYSFHDAGKIVLLVLSLIGFIFFDTVYVGAVFNYAAQSEMNIYLLRAVRRLVIQKEYVEMDAAIKVHLYISTVQLGYNYYANGTCTYNSIDPLPCYRMRVSTILTTPYQTKGRMF